MLRRFCLLLMACAGCATLIIPRAVQAQVDTVRTDTVRVDPTALQLDSARADSLRADSIRFDAIRREAERAADTIKAPLARYVPPANTESFGRRRWTREDMFASGAVNLADLLDDIPGVTTFRTAWFPSVHAAAFQGDFRRLRVFMDGIELDAPDPSNNGVLDLVEISLAALDEVLVERAAGEVRVWLTSWTVTSVTPYSRTDVFTGDLNTNGFRGLFGRRFMNGALVQFTLQQGESARRRGNLGFGGPSASGETGDGDVRLVTARTGWARGVLSIDGYLSYASRSRDIMEGTDGLFVVPAYSGTRTESYLRLGYGNPSRGWSAQAVLNRLSTGPSQEDLTDPAQPPPDPEEAPPAPVIPDSSRSISQRFLYAGYAFENARAGAFARWRSFDGRSDIAPGVQGSIDRGWLSASLHAERIGLDSSVRADASVRATVRPWLIATAAHSALRPDEETGRLNESTSRIGGAVGWRNRWLSAGLIRQSIEQKLETVIDTIDDPQNPGETIEQVSQRLATRRVIVPRLLTPFDTADAPQFLPFTGTGLTFGAEMPIYKDFRLELQGTRWNGTREYRPQTQVRASFILQSDWRSRFPKGHFSINARLMHEYRSGVNFVEADLVGTPDPFRTSEPYSLGIALLEIRILRATMFYQFRNVYGGPYEQVAGIPMPPPFQMYGVRWEWFN